MIGQNALICKMENITKVYGHKIHALNGLDFSIPKGKIIGVLGPNGSGKSTMFKILAGLIENYRGNFSFSEKLKIGYMPQEFSLYQDLSIEENLEFFGRIQGIKDKKLLKKQINYFLDLFALTQRKKDLIRELSGGLKQRTSLCASILHEPDFILLDEPTVGTDPLLRRRFWDFFNSLKKKGKTILVSTHVFDEAKMCDYLVFVREGKIIAEGEREEMIARTGILDFEELFAYFAELEVKEERNSAKENRNGSTGYENGETEVRK